jgi:prevent-host-death family protein
MREMSASEVARRFSAVLDGAEHGETIVVTRGGRRVALIVPAPLANGQAVGEVLARWRGRLDVDDAFAARVAAAGDATVDLDRDPWRE